MNSLAIKKMKIGLSETICKLQDAIIEKNGGRLQVLEEEIQSLMQRDRDLLCASDEDLKKFGPKFVNLIKMSRLIKGLDLEGFEVHIPMGYVLDVDISRPWNALRNLFNGNLERGDVKALLGEIIQRISDAPLEISPEFEAWLQKCQGRYLMVRSSGMEDLSECSNAGGNLSLAYVLPEREAFCQAAKKVIISYYLKDSLQNLVNAGQNPFLSEPPLAVIAQEVIGEPLSNQNPAEIPTSLVLFTNEPLYIGDESFRFMRISASWGHGEGVVEAAGVGTDTIYLLVSDANPSELSIYYDNAEKPQRLAPVAGEGLQLVDNPTSMRHLPSLSSELLARLYTWGVAAEAFFDGHPTDMEIVIKKDVIYPVQARRLKRPTLSPTYFEGGAPFIKGQVIVPGKMNAVCIDSLKELRLAASLGIAEKGFAKHKAVIVLHPEPANSHPVVNFSSLGIPCLYVSEAQKVFELTKKFTSQHQVVLCSQTGNVHLLPKGDISRSILPGFVAHPAVFRTTGTMPEIEKKIEEATREVEAATGVRRLYRVKVLEALHLERVAAEPMAERARALAIYQNKFHHPVKYSDLYLLGDSAIEPSSTQMWRDFIEKIEMFDDQPRLHEMMRILESSGMLPTWFAFFFKGGSVEEVLGTLPPQDDRKIGQLCELHVSIKALMGSLNGFSKRKSFGTLYKRLELLVSKIETGRISQYMETSPVTRLILLNILDDVVELHDLSIKQMKGSLEWKVEEKVPLVKKMLRTYFSLLKCWVKELKPKIANAQEGEWEYQYQDCLTVQMWNMETAFSDLNGNTPAQLEPSADFSAGGEAIGSNTVYQGGNTPRTLEDLFVLIHTNHTTVLAHFKNKEIGFELLEDAHLPPFLHEHLLIKQSGVDYFKRTKTGINISDKEIVIKYVMPLRHHAAQITLKYETGSKETTLKCDFFGLPQYDRWVDIALNATIFHDLNIFTLNAPIMLARSELKLEWKVREPAEIDKILQEIQHLGKISCTLQVDIGIPTKFDRVLPHIAPAALVRYLLEKLNDEESIDVGYTPSSNREHLIKSILCCPQLMEAGKSDLEEAAIAFVQEALESQGEQRCARAFEAIKSLLTGGCPQRLVDLVMAIAAEHHILEIVKTAVKNKLTIPLNIALHYAKDSMELMIALVENGYDCLDEAEAVAKGSPKLLRQLVKRGRGYHAAREHVELYPELIKQGQFLAEAESYARTLSKRSERILLYQELVAASRYYHEALEEAKLGFYDSDHYVNSISLDLFQKLVEKGQFYAEATNAAVEGFSRNLNPFDIGALFISLLKKGVGFEPFITLFDTRDPDHMSSLPYLIDDFLQINQPRENIERMLNKIKSILLCGHYYIRGIGCQIFDKFLSKGFGVAQVLELIKTPLYCDIYVLFHRIDIASYKQEAIELIRNGDGKEDLYRETLSLYLKVAEAVPPDVEELVLTMPKKVPLQTHHISTTCNMFKEMLRRRGRYEAALEAALGWLRNYNDEIRKNGVELLTEILAAQRGHTEVFQTAMEMIKEKEEHQLIAVRLINQLIKNGFKPTPADAKAILLEIKNSTEAVREEAFPFKRIISSL